MTGGLTNLHTIQGRLRREDDFQLVPPSKISLSVSLSVCQSSIACVSYAATFTRDGNTFTLPYYVYTIFNATYRQANRQAKRQTETGISTQGKPTSKHATDTDTYTDTYTQTHKHTHSLLARAHIGYTHTGSCTLNIRSQARIKLRGKNSNNDPHEHQHDTSDTLKC